MVLLHTGLMHFCIGLQIQGGEKMNEQRLGPSRKLNFWAQDPSMHFELWEIFYQDQGP